MQGDFLVDKVFPNQALPNCIIVQNDHSTPFTKVKDKIYFL